MSDPDIRDDIAQLEERIDTLRRSLERCRKVAIVARSAIALAVLWLALTLLSLMPFNPTPFFAALAAALGAVVMLGSNKTTAEQTAAQLHEAEATRAQFIDSLAMRTVDARPTIH